MTDPAVPPAAYDPRRDFARPPEVVVIDGHRAACDGGGGALGHPRVWLELGHADHVDCGYCDRRFARRGSASDPATHPMTGA